MEKMKSGTRIKLISKCKTLTSSYDITSASIGYSTRTTVTNDPKEVMSIIERNTGDEEVIGLEVQYSRHSKKPAILTLSGFNSGLTNLIIQLPNFRDKIPDQLRNLFSDKRCKFVGENVGRTVAMLKEEYDINVDRYEDFSDIAGRSLGEFLRPAFSRTVSKLKMELMVMRKTPEIEDAVWEEEELDDDLVTYATLDSYLSFFVGLGAKKGIN